MPENSSKLAMAAAALCSLAALAVVPLIVGDYGLTLLVMAGYYVILAVSWNLLAGYTGLFSLGHQGLAAIGAYTSGLMTYYWGASLWLSMPAGILAATLSGYLLGRIVLGMRAIYFAVATWAFSESVRIIIGASYKITRGELGLSVPPMFASGGPLGDYLVMVGAAWAVCAVGYLLVRGRFGFFLRAIKDDELRAESIGIDTVDTKIKIFTFSSALAGIAGVFYAHTVLVLSPQMADFNEMAKLIVMVVLGGLGSFFGPIVAVFPVHFITTYLQAYGEWSLGIFALVVIVLMRTNPGGFASVAGRLFRAGRASAS